ncbi:MAG: NAD-glutamate dehydrogenase, partial [Pseudomonadota bacterium]
PKVFIRRDPFQRFISALVYIPRDNYRGDLREKTAEALAETFNGQLSTFYIQMADDVLARLHFIFRTTPGGIPDFDESKLDEMVEGIIKGWSERFLEALQLGHGEADGRLLYLEHQKSFSAAYQEQFTPEAAVMDIGQLASLKGTDDVAFHLYRLPGDDMSRARLKLYHIRDMVPLSDCLPLLENAGLRVLEEFPYNLQLDKVGWIHDFLLAHPRGEDIALAEVRETLEQGLADVMAGRYDNDGFNALMMSPGLSPDRANLMRAYGRFLRQVGLSFSQGYIETCLTLNGGVVRLLIDYFGARFDPALNTDASTRDEALETLETQILAALDDVQSVDYDRILRSYFMAMKATLRTNAYQIDDDGKLPQTLAFKIRSTDVPDMPKPKPFVEIFVYGRRVEGVHLRGGPIARGGLRWSDRQEDYRTEVLGLVKAQMVKNAVIVPVGAKGGFFARQLPPPGDRDAYVAEGIEAYKAFIGSLLSITDNLVEGDVVPPPNVVRYDDDDPYLVVAADKGTAQFSDIANGLAIERGFWLADAFASGGTNGYDHKKMAITARGAWVSVQRHFREIGVNIQKEPFTVVGIGDMSGDVFGNGMLLSDQIKLVAAFDHRHIFVDPNPDPATSFKERKRLFELNRSTWEDYDTELLSKGARIFPRSAKSLQLTDEIKALFGLSKDKVTPLELMRTILQHQADLLWFGGIGTYVKAGEESHGDVGDKANDALRVNGIEVRAKVIGEGANLGITQQGRIEYSRHGGRINTDFIDNSAGVDCSDNEVNIKIALTDAIRRDMLEAEARDPLLEEMTDNVADLVLRNNYLQSQAISMAEAQSAKEVHAQARLIERLERDGDLERDIENLPSADKLGDLIAKNEGLSRPEIAVVMAYAKNSLTEELKTSRLMTNPWLKRELCEAFPQTLADRFEPCLVEHRLSREIVATRLANAVINRGGLTMAFDMQTATGYPLDDIAAAFLVTREVFDMRTLWRLIDDHDYKVPSSIQILMHLEVAATLRRQVNWFVNNLPHPLDIEQAIDDFRDGVRALLADPGKVLAAFEMKMLKRRQDMYEVQGIPSEVAVRVACLEALAPVTDIVAVSQNKNRPVEEVALAYFEIGHRIGFNWLRAAAEEARGDDQWERLAAGTIADDLLSQQRRLTELMSDTRPSTEGGCDAAANWIDGNARAIEIAANLVSEIRDSGPMTMAKLGYAARRLRSLLIPN